MTTVLIAGMIVLGIINLMLLFFVFSLFKDNSALKLLITQMHAGLGNLSTRILNQDAYLQKVGASFAEFTTIMEDLVERMDSPEHMMGPNPKLGMMYRTLDGKYAAGSLEDLINKIKKDGTQESYLSPEELSDLRKMFDGEDASPLDDEETEFDDEDEDDDTFNPDKGPVL